MVEGNHGKVLDDLAIEAAEQVDIGPGQHLGQPPAGHGVGVGVVAAKCRGGVLGCPRRRSGAGARGRSTPCVGRGPRSCPRDSPGARPSPVRRPGRRSRLDPGRCRFPRPRTRPASGRGNSSSRSTARIPWSRTGFGQPAKISARPELPGTSPRWNWVPRSQLTSNGSSSSGRGSVVPEASTASRWRYAARVSWSLSCRENDAPGTAVAQDRIVAQPAHGNHDVGVGDVPIEVNPPSFLRGRQVSQLGLVRGIVDLDAMPRGNSSEARPGGPARPRPSHRRARHPTRTQDQPRPQHGRDRGQRRVQCDRHPVARHDDLPHRRKFEWLLQARSVRPRPPLPDPSAGPYHGPTSVSSGNSRLELLILKLDRNLHGDDVVMPSCVPCHPAPVRRDRSRWFECGDGIHDRAGRGTGSSGPVIVTAEPIRHDRGSTGSFVQEGDSPVSLALTSQSPRAVASSWDSGETRRASA